MRMYSLFLAAALVVGSLSPSYAKTRRPQSSNANVKRAMKKAKKVRPAKYKPAKKSKKPARAVYGAR